MSAALLVAIALATAGAASVSGDRVSRGWSLLAGCVALALFALVAAVVDPLRIVRLIDTPVALGIDGALVASAAGASLLLLLITSLSPDPAASGKVAAGDEAPGGAAAVEATADGSSGDLHPAVLRMEEARAAAPIAAGMTAAGAALAALSATIGVLNGALMSPGAGTDAARPLQMAPVVAFAAVTGAAALGASLLSAAPGPASLREAVRIASRGLRVDVAAGVVGLAGAAWLLGEHGIVSADPNGIAAAVLLVAAGVGILSGAIPFHGLAARAASIGSGMLQAARSVWVPAAFSLGAIGWEQHVLLPALGFGGLGGAPVVADVRALVWIAAILTLVGGALAATLRDDLRHVAVYATLADWALVLVAIASADPARATVAQDWIAVNAVAKTALVTWCVALSGSVGSSEVDDLAGWARRAPILLVSLAVITIATFGIPGIGAFPLRSALVRDAGLAGLLLLSASWLGLLPYLRLVVVGLRRPSAGVEAAPGELPVRVGTRPSPAREQRAGAGPVPAPTSARRAPRGTSAPGPSARGTSARGTSAPGPSAPGTSAPDRRKARGIAPGLALSRLHRTAGVIGAAWTSYGVPIAALLTLAAALLAAGLAWAAGGQSTLVE